MELPPPPIQEPKLQTLRTLPVLVAAVIAFAIAIAIYAVGLGMTSSTWEHSENFESEIVPTNVQPAVRYADMDGKQRGPNQHYNSHLATLLSPSPALFDQVDQTIEQRQAALAMRASRRAYDGAPPTIPHAVNANEINSCLVCHGEGKIIDGRIATRISHQHLVNCTQCHAQAGSPGLGPEFPVDNTFVGKSSPTHGTRAYKGAPPTIPHNQWMRENCTSCHGVNGRLGMRSTHPWRVNCVQCHAASAELDNHNFHTLGGDGPPAPPLIDRTPTK